MGTTKLVLSRPYSIGVCTGYSYWVNGELTRCPPEYHYDLDGWEKNCGHNVFRIDNWHELDHQRVDEWTI